MTETTFFIIIGLTGITCLIFIVKYLRIILKKNDFTIEVENCKGCPFKVKEDNSYVSCNLKRALQKDNNWYCNEILMKGSCPVNKQGEFTINLNKK